VKVAIFDMDGTLIDTQHDITVSINHVRRLHYDLEPLSSAFVVEAINRDQRNLAQLFYGTEVYQEHDRKLFETHYHEQCINAPRLYDGIEETIKQLYHRDVKLAVATNAPTKFAIRMLNHLEVSHYFGHIIGADRVEYPKPNRAMIEHILGAYGFAHAKDEGWMIGDNSKDMEAARSAQITGVFATWGFSPVGLGDLVLSDPRELLELLG
jgi:phosphoglycolate phosphatase